jgi:hypothetical protein
MPIIANQLARQNNWGGVYVVVGMMSTLGVGVAMAFSKLTYDCSQTLCPDKFQTFSIGAAAYQQCLTSESFRCNQWHSTDN